MRGFAIAVAILAAVSLVVPDVFRHAGAYRDIERGFTAGGGASHLYRWWPVSRVAADRAVAVAERAIRRAPRHAWSHVMLGRVRLLDIARRRQATERQLRESHQHLPEPSLRGMVSAVLADDCLAATQAAIEDCRRAIRLAPLEPFHYAYTIRSIGVLIPLLYDPDERDAVLNRLLWAVDAAVMLAPTDTTWVLLPAIQTLAGIAVDTPESDVWKPVLKDRVHDLGIRLMRLHGESVNRVAEVFMALDIDLSTALPASGIPLMQLRGLYAYCLRQGDFSAAQSIIERILGKIDNPEIPLGAIDPRDETAAHREALRVQMACARVRLLLLQGRIATLGDTHPDVREARRLLVDEQLMQSGQETLPTTSMARVHRSHGLPEDRFLQWIRLLLVAGDHAVVDTQMIRHLLAAWDRGEIIPWDQVNRIVRDLPHDAAAGLLVEAMLAMEAHRYPAVVDAIRRLLDAQGLPVAARPLVQVLLADSYQGSGNVAARDIALRRALAAAPRLSAAWTRVKAWDVALPHASGGAMASEDVMLPLTFLGGAIEVVGFTFDEYRMSISVTFRGPVPSDLTMAVAVYDADGQWLGGARHAFARSHAATFASGNPAWGDRYRIERSLRTFGSPPDRLVVGFRSSREPTPIITSYGQRSIDIRGLSRTLTVP